jgi:hypothetical protein
MPNLYKKVSEFLSRKKGREADFSKLNITSGAQVCLGDSYLLELADPLHREGKYLVGEYKKWEDSQYKDLGLDFFFFFLEREHLIQFTKQAAYQCSIQNGYLKNASG